MVQIDTYEWLYYGCFIQVFQHPKLIGKYEVYKNNKEQSHIGRCSTFVEAKRLAKENQCSDNYLKF